MTHRRPSARRAWLPALLLPLLLASCSCPRQLQRMQRRCPECFEAVTITDTLFIPHTVADTHFLLTPTPRDTFRLETEKVQLQIIRTVDTLHTTLHTKPDTIILTRTITHPQPPRPRPRLFLFIAAALAALAAALAIKRK